MGDSVPTVSSYRRDRCWGALSAVPAERLGGTCRGSRDGPAPRPTASCGRWCGVPASLFSTKYTLSRTGLVGQEDAPSYRHPQAAPDFVCAASARFPPPLRPELAGRACASRWTQPRSRVVSARKLVQRHENPQGFSTLVVQHPNAAKRHLQLGDVVDVFKQRRRSSGSGTGV